MTSLDITNYIFYIIKTRSMHKTFMLLNKFAAGTKQGLSSGGTISNKNLGQILDTLEARVCVMGPSSPSLPHTHEYICLLRSSGGDGHKKVLSFPLVCTKSFGTKVEDVCAQSRSASSATKKVHCLAATKSRFCPLCTQLCHIGHSQDIE